MKRKNEDQLDFVANGKPKKRAFTDQEVKRNFRTGLFDTKVLKQYTDEYAESQPYKHGVIANLINAQLLRNVRDEIRQNLHFTPKETDIYKIHQSGDLANLDGLDNASLGLLPSLLTLRDALYSSTFRHYISTVAGAGPLSGKKTDMAINVYTPGCHLLCHDDVIGSRRVSYILYLTDPDVAWKPEWGGALRLYPAEIMEDEKGDKTKVPSPEFSEVVPPSWNQLAFFAVQPGESFHDVEEVYKRSDGDTNEDGGRVRMAISGWYHIPQEGEDGYEEGLEETLAQKSSLAQLQGKADTFDLPQPQWNERKQEDTDEGSEGEPELTEEDLQFLLKYVTPTYLTPDTVEELSEMFEEECTLRLANFLSKRFSAQLRTYLESTDIQPADPGLFSVARPPHKHRFLYRQPLVGSASNAPQPKSVYEELIDVFFPSPAFKKWLSLATGLTLTRASVLARRFRKGLDYTLATSYEEEEPQLEVCLAITPTRGWGDDKQDELDNAAATTDDDVMNRNGEKANGRVRSSDEGKAAEDSLLKDEDGVGGYELYMAGDDDDDVSDDGSDHGVEIPASAKNQPSSHTGAGKRRKADPAIYKSSSGTNEDDGVLFSMPAGWNNMSVVLRDKGTLRFVKYVSKAAKGDRWDICADFGVKPEDEDNEDDDGGATDGQGRKERSDVPVEEDEEDEEEEEWKGFDD
ncbi:hypothetical protein B0A49_11058 [Cryomyces minteri]|uniref:uS12 prolyl 3,4-dihydroxylase n=1 Tax=Cryomyces minteri TaxID=331657 RepID=A0A4U0WM45_9PEZI|nr:hypothetical protein B0A49_11058 [Cryomyces minteri]